ncbi:MAG: kelch repeat-containing protein [Phycisphaerales bacterium]
MQQNPELVGEHINHFDERPSGIASNILFNHCINCTYMNLLGRRIQAYRIIEMPFCALIAMVVLCTGCTNRNPGIKSEVTDIWQSMPPLPVGNAGFIAGFVGDRLLIVGGTNWAGGSKYWLKDVWDFPPDSTQWHVLAPLPSPIAYAAFGHNDDGLYWLGGSDGTAASDSLYRVTTDAKIEHISDTGYKVVYAGGTADDFALYVVAGSESVTDLSQLTDRFLRASLATGEVSRLPSYPGGAVMLPAVVCAGNEVFVFGGGRYDKTSGMVVNTTDAYAYSLQHSTWRKLTPLPYARRGMAACQFDRQTILIGGGFGGLNNHPQEGFTNDALLYRLSDNRYLPAPDLPYAAMGQTLIHHHGALYILGGEDRPRHRTSVFYINRIVDGHSP